MKPVAIIQHLATDGAAYFAVWLQAQDIPFRLFQMHEGDHLPADITQHAGLCILGGAMSANDALPYYPALLDQIRLCVDRNIPVIGHCLGGQLMARALGGTVQASENVEIGWSEMESVHADAAEWFGPGRFDIFQWHGESFSIPPGATQLLRGRHCANQAFVVGDRHLGMQFHCEVDAAKIRYWLQADAAEMAGSSSPGVQSSDSILATLDRDLRASQAVADRIYARWARHLQR
ncbi:MAG: type 1 glutamine amidotransferase [Burkholderiaceae bacterium]|nr:type 1 glutamine amidotransferase [Roseateles sp.]MBV8469614.1 type 1 glutamine amidotransferase [Burkholderiaceae bacterium]